MTEPQLVDVVVRQVPVRLWQKSQEHSDELMREFMLIASERSQEDGVPDEVPTRLVTLIDEVTAQYSGFSETQERMLLDAAAEGRESIDLHYRLPSGIGSAAAHLADLLDEADDYCRRGQHLLTLATPPAQVAFRRWLLDEFVRQVEGQDPTPWPDYARQAGVSEL
jgi:hypothetical protein